MNYWPFKKKKVRGFRLTRKRNDEQAGKKREN